MAVEILAYLVAQSLGTDAVADATVDNAIFRELMPDTPNVCGSVHSYGAAPPVNGLGTDGIRFEMPGVQVRWRGDPWDVDTPEAKIQAAFVALGKIQAQTLTTTAYLMVRPVRSPEIFERDSKNRVVWIVSAICEKELS